ncbi:Dihydroneopterin aldolase-domain-containing protein [Coprinopsis sp. MPI-PUGE-AT-0042]|nr:Dihydroneopterin aldolase-domain-containing protein [Coprinopsis sp. MPI-PUGE-AT-0042]
MPLTNVAQATDKVFIDTLRISTANIGQDCWGKSRPQPLELSIYLHLQPSFLNKSGTSDDVVDSVHYGHLTKAISSLIDSKSTASDGSERKNAFDGIDGLVKEVSEEAFKLAGDAAAEVRVVVNAPNLILLAGDFIVDTTIAKNERGEGSPLGRVVSIRDLTIPVIIGVNPPERLAKQKVVTDLIFYENAPVPHLEYQMVVADLVKDIEVSEFLTIEKFVMEIAKKACLSLPSCEAVTVRSQKPSALTFARYSGVEITRRRADLL